MFSDKEFKTYAISSGKNINEVKKIYANAVKESKSLGKENDKYFVIEMFEDMLGLEESTLIPQLVHKFIESDYETFDEFIEMLSSDDISPDTRPEMRIDGPVVSSEFDITDKNKKNIIDDSEGLIEKEIEEELLKLKKDKDVVLDSDDEVKNDKKLLVGSQ